jgi:hypothetical protein
VRENSFIELLNVEQTIRITNCRSLAILEQLVFELQRALRNCARKAAEKTAEISTSGVRHSFDVIFQSDQFTLLKR